MAASCPQESVGLGRTGHTAPGVKLGLRPSGYGQAFPALSLGYGVRTAKRAVHGLQNHGVEGVGPRKGVFVSVGVAREVGSSVGRRLVEDQKRPPAPA